MTRKDCKVLAKISHFKRQECKERMLGPEADCTALSKETSTKSSRLTRPTTAASSLSR